MYTIPLPTQMFIEEVTFSKMILFQATVGFK